MANYQSDLRDINFNLFDVLQVQKHSYGLERSDLETIVSEFDSFVGKEIFPTRQKSDVNGAKWTPEGVKAPAIFRDPTRKFYENGWFALGLPDTVGGSPVPEAITTACLSLATGANCAWSMYPGLTKAALNVILHVGSKEQQAVYVQPMVEGRFGGTMCLTEADAGSDVGNLRSTAKPLGNGRYSIEGTKIFISSGDNDLYENIVHLVLARTPGGAPGTKGLSLFIVPKYKVKPDGSKGESNDVNCSKIEEKMGLHANATCELVFGKNKKCEGWLIGEEFDGMKNMFIMMNEARLYCGVQGESQANLAYQLTHQYVFERVQFGKPIIEHPDVRRTMLKMRAMARGLRALCLYTADLFDRKEEDEVGLLTPICKAYASDEAMRLSSDAVQSHGGYGFCTEYGIEQFMRDIKIAAIYEGTNAIQAIDFVMRKILKDNGKTFGNLGKKIMASMQKPDAQKLFPAELQTLGLSLQKAQEILHNFGKLAMAGKMDAVLLHCSDFLKYAGHIVTAWRLLEHALLAESKMASASGEEKAFLQTKQQDFRIFCQFFVTENIGLGKLLANTDIDLTYKA
ncbi:MAG TPA: acyl-CoA dehydrogenase family protein [Oligoflexus sp.]|uniref:acyl-CoA dehydrogenase n=1 Tax=Oligoflexus sp. TaxID=1971216 RepID=UPI002D7E41DD|nr:acyl-CoA dehydrogenase family protein [Oligoflexus sp.]HET9236808.1 acyl-CoA dehydrogenase family protein [Oligoflexus sp.]